LALVDPQWCAGEVFSPAYFGVWEPPGPKMRSAEEICAYVPNDVRRDAFCH